MIKGKYVSQGLIVLVSLFLGSWQVQANEKFDEKIKTLNLLTGNKSVQGQFKSLMEDKKSINPLLEYAAKQVKKDESLLSFNAAFILAACAQAQDKDSAAETFLRVCAEQAGKLESEKKIRRAYLGLIDLYYDSGQFKKCARVCKEIMELDLGGDQPRKVLLPVTRFGKDDFDIEKNYDCAQNIKPYARIYQIRSITKLGQFKEAKNQMEDLLQLSNHWQIRAIYGWVLRESGDFKEALDVYESVVDSVVQDQTLKDDEKKAYEDQYRSILSGIYVDLGQLKKATNQLKDLVARYPDEPGFYNDLGYIMADNGLDLREAEKYIRKAVELDQKKLKAREDYDPKTDVGNGAYLDSLGWVLFKQKKYKEAREWLLKAVKDKNSQHIEIYDHLGDAHLALGETQQALKAWQRGVQLAGENARERERKVNVLKKIEKYSQE